MENFSFIKPKNFSKLPGTTGIYCFKRNGQFLYIGKALNIRERVKNHFQSQNYRDNLYLDSMKSIGYIETNSEIEALILEAKLIKKYQPKYNTIWKDDKNYFFVGITKEDFPKVFITHQTKKIKIPKSKIQTKSKIQNPKLAFIGPFVDGGALKQTLKSLRKAFPYRSCNKIPKHPCLWYQLKRCPGPCSLKIEGYPISLNLKNAKNILKILQGKKKRVLTDLKKEMNLASESQDFEKAAKIRDRIIALEKVMKHAKILEPVEVRPQPVPRLGLLQEVLKSKKEIKRIEAYDISNIQGQTAAGSLVVFTEGKPDKSQYRKFKIKIAEKPNDTAMIKEVLTRRLAHEEWSYPDLILIDGGIAQLNAALEIKNEKCKVKNYNLKLKIMSLAKKKNELFIEGRKKPILLKALPREIFNLILQLRDEAHRFAIKYHHKLREVDLKPKS